MKYHTRFLSGRGNRKLRAWIELTRPVNILITMLSIPAACVLAGSQSGQWPLIAAAALTGALVAAGANAINDYFDVEIDKINKPDRPIPSGVLNRKEALAAWIVLSVAGISVNLALNSAALAIAVSAVIALYFYSAVLKRTVILGNLVVGLMTGMAFIYGGVVVGKFERAVMPALFAFLINVAREVVKDLEDIEGDRSGNAMTLPVRHGVKPALWFATIVIGTLMLTTIAAYALHLYNLIYLCLVLAIDCILVFAVVSMWHNSAPDNMKRLSTGLKACMVIGLIAIYFGS
jgi:geranylgeranylglycerol-phosphate geranylgeranyltransferase